MLVIRQAQVDALIDERLREFRSWMLRHLREHFAAQLQDKSDDDLRTLIDDGLCRARRFGLDRRTSLCSFIDLMVLFGPGFENKREYPWVARALDDTRLVNPDARMAMMMRYAIDWLHGSLPALPSPTEKPSR